MMELMEPFLCGLRPNAGFQCLALLICHYLLRNPTGYDSRIRVVFKRLSVIVLSYEISKQNAIPSCSTYDTDNNSGEKAAITEKMAMLKFDALERSVAQKLLSLSKEVELQEERNRQYNHGTHCNHSSENTEKAVEVKTTLFNRDQMLRGIKIGSVGVLAGTIFALTGGIAAPGIAASVAAVAGSAAAATIAVATLANTAAVPILFGVGGGGLAAYKMHRRQRGLTEFEFTRENTSIPAQKQRSDPNFPIPSAPPELFTTICISGWLTDKHGFQRPWGVQPRGLNRLERLQRFYQIHNPEKESQCIKILERWKDEERQLWMVLREKYGADPDHLLPLDGPCRQTCLTDEEDNILNLLLEELGYPAIPKPANSNVYDGHDPAMNESVPLNSNQQNCFDNLLNNITHNTTENLKTYSPPNQNPLFNGNGTVSNNVEGMTENGDIQMELTTKMLGTTQSDIMSPIQTKNKDEKAGPPFRTQERGVISKNQDKVCDVLLSPLPNSSTTINTQSTTLTCSSKVPSPTVSSGGDFSSVVQQLQQQPARKRMLAWDYQADYAGELYTVKWESSLLMELCDSVTDMTIDFVGGATKEILRHSALAAILSAVALPIALVNAAHMIDGTWTLAIERADEAGAELARCLLESEAGHRPVTLVGFSMGARLIYSCLKELDRHQTIWENQRETKNDIGKSEINRDKREESFANRSGNADKKAEHSSRRHSLRSTSDYDLINDYNEQRQEHRNGYNDAGTVNDKSLSPSTSGNSTKVLYKREPASIVEDAILMGLPNHFSSNGWAACRRIVPGRLVNCFSRKDLILSLMFQLKRMSGILRPVCGTNPVDIPGVENYDVSGFVSSHSDYCIAIKDILRFVKHGYPMDHPSSVIVQMASANDDGLSDNTAKSVNNRIHTTNSGCAIPTERNTTSN